MAKKKQKDTEFYRGADLLGPTRNPRRTKALLAHLDNDSGNVRGMSHDRGIRRLTSEAIASGSPSKAKLAKLREAAAVFAKANPVERAMMAAELPNDALADLALFSHQQMALRAFEEEFGYEGLSDCIGDEAIEEINDVLANNVGEFKGDGEKATLDEDNEKKVRVAEVLRQASKAFHAEFLSVKKGKPGTLSTDIDNTTDERRFVLHAIGGGNAVIRGKGLPYLQLFPIRTLDK